MKMRAAFALVAGTLVGAWPFWALTAVRPVVPGHGEIAFAIAIVLSALSFRHPVLWFAGLAAGTTLGWIVFVLVLGSDWRLLAYVVLDAGTYYLANLAVAVGVAAFVSSRDAATRSGPGRPARPDSR